MWRRWDLLCKGHQREEVRRWGPRVDAGGPDLTVKVGGREEGSLLVLVTGLPFGLLPCKVRSVLASHLLAVHTGCFVTPRGRGLKLEPLLSHIA